MTKSIEELEKIGISLEQVSKILEFDKDKKYNYRHGRRELSIKDYYTVMEASGFVLMPIRKGKKIIIVDEEKEV